MVRVNIGCGMTPTYGWENFDNSLSVRLARFPFLCFLLSKVRLLSRQQMEFVSFCRKNNVQWADSTRRIPLLDGSVEVLYSSHMLEHLDRKEAALFLKEAHRVLAVGGTIRLAVPDIEKKVRVYNETADADAFIESTHMCVPRPRTVSDRIRLLLVGTRHHQWMYDGRSLSKLLEGSGFSNSTVLAAGETTISNVEPLDLAERVDESVYVEATRV